MAIQVQKYIMIYKNLLNKFVITSQPENKDNFIFSIQQKEKLAKYIYNIWDIADIAKKLKLKCNLIISTLYKLINIILKMAILLVTIINNCMTKLILIRAIIMKSTN